MQAGRLDRRIVLQRATITRDEFNAEVETWADLATVWASYRPVSDGERFRAGERAAEISARFQIRYSSIVKDVTPKDRLVFDGRAYAITHVKEIGRREGIELTAVGRGDG
ncbi:phage head closure protein [Brevundimonas pondensis]|uniref:Phage head closure protein n=1 Tax=Brevundimonas pondensis TaxID=2774189 RepID=A0ABX7SPE9_9CAUL|nr:phage head closure protein [Brevundimonas pondensis]QTC88185.1 phage head closure protein [Brevundimonas pondensis]